MAGASNPGGPAVVCTPLEGDVDLAGGGVGVDP